MFGGFEPHTLIKGPGRKRRFNQACFKARVAAKIFFNYFKKSCSESAPRICRMHIKSVNFFAPPAAESGNYAINLNHPKLFSFDNSLKIILWLPFTDPGFDLLGIVIF